MEEENHINSSATKVELPKENPVASWLYEFNTKKLCFYSS